MARKIEVEILGDDRDLRRAFSRSSKDAQNWGQNIGRVARGSVVATVGFRGLGRSVAFASAAFLGGAGFTAVVKGSIDAASNLNEQLNKTKVIFDQSSDSVVAWSRTTAKALGVSQSAALEAAGGFGAMLETAGLTSREASKFSTRLVQLAADMASFNNIDPSEALDKLKSGLAGEAEPLRTVGVLLSETRVKQEAYRSGLAKSGATLTEQQKVLARYNLILKDTGRQQGDFARTSGGLANQQRILAAQVENLQAKLGAALLPSVLKVVTALNKWLGSSKNQARLQRDVNEAVRTAGAVIEDFVGVMRPLVAAAQDANRALGGLRKTVELLLVALVVSKVVSMTGAITGLGGQAAKSATGIKALRISLLRLGAIGLITVGVEVILNRRSIDKSVTDFLRRHRLSFLAGGSKLEIPAELNVPDLEKARANVARLKGENDLLAKGLGELVDALHKIDEVRFGKALKQAQALRERLDAIKTKKVSVEVVERGLQRVRNQLDKVKDKRAVGFTITQKGIEELERKLRGVKGKSIDVTVAERGLAEVRRGLESLRDKTVHVTIDMRVFENRPEEGTRGTGAGARAFTRDRAAQVAEENAKEAGAAEKKSAEAAAAARKASARAAARAAAAATKAKEQAIAAFSAISDSFSLQLDEAESKRRFGQELKILSQQEQAIRDEIKIEGKTADLQRQLFDIRQKRIEIQKQIAEQGRERRQTRQFRALNLTDEGGQRVPSVAALTKRLGSLREQVKGTVLDTPKTQSELARIAKVLAGKFGKVGRDVRAAILQMFKDIAGGLDQGSDTAKGPLTKFAKRGSGKLLEGLGLSAEQVKALRQRLAQVGPGGTAPSRGVGAFGMAFATSTPSGAPPIVVQSNTKLYLDGKVLAVSTTKQQQKKAGRTAASRRGTNPGSRG